MERMIRQWADAWNIDKQATEDLLRQVQELDTSSFDKIFMTEILNELYGISGFWGSKAETLLRDWAKELRRKAAFPPSRHARYYREYLGPQR